VKRFRDADVFRCRGCGSWRIRSLGSCVTCRVKFHRDSVLTLLGEL
jgi:predicted ATP-dependent serine protease